MNVINGKLKLYASLFPQLPIYCTTLGYVVLCCVVCFVLFLLNVCCCSSNKRLLHKEFKHYHSIFNSSSCSLFFTILIVHIKSTHTQAHMIKTLVFHLLWIRPPKHNVISLDFWFWQLHKEKLFPFHSYDNNNDKNKFVPMCHLVIGMLYIRHKLVAFNANLSKKKPTNDTAELNGEW